MFFACGLNHKTAPLALREQIAMPIGSQCKPLTNLLKLPSINEAVILSTCNRTEIYCEAKHIDMIMPWIAEEHGLALESIRPYFYSYQDDLAIRHALRVCSGLDSMMLGEPQILGQMKQAYQEAHQYGAVKDTLRQLFQYLFNASKRVRHLSGVGNNPVSIAFAAVQLISRYFKAYEPLTVMLIGSGETSSLVAKYLQQQGVNQFIIASRTADNAQNLAKTIHGQIISITDIPQHLPKADVVISATTCPLPFINKAMVQQALQQSPKSAVLFLDLSVPRDVEANVTELEGVYLHNIDELHQVIDHGMNERKAAAIHAEELIDDALKHYVRWHRSLKANEMICDYRNQMQSLAKQELRRAMQKLSAGHCQFDVLNEFSERLVNKLTHSPTVGLKQAASDNRDELLDLAQYLFKPSAESANLVNEISIHEEVSTSQT